MRKIIPICLILFNAGCCSTRSVGIEYPEGSNHFYEVTEDCDGITYTDHTTYDEEGWIVVENVPERVKELWREFWHKI